VREGQIHWQRVEVSADVGDHLAIATGLSDGDTVVLTPTERLTEGERVQPQGSP
jgi:hypothetical protein